MTLAPVAEPAADAVARGADDADTLQRETALYNMARQSGQRADYEAYVETFPNGLYVANARKQIERLPAAPASGGLVASLGNVAPAPQPVTENLQAGLPAAGLAAGAAAAVISGEGTEAILGLDRALRKEVQLRLNLAGYNSGTPDGAFGPNTRNAIIAWQSARGVHVSGYLNRPQYDLLVSQTQAALAAYTPPAPPKARNVAPRRETRSYQQQRRQQANPRVVRRVSPRGRSNGPSAGEAAFFGGLVGGIIGGAIRR